MSSTTSAADISSSSSTVNASLSLPDRPLRRARYSQVVAQVAQVACDKCGASLVPDAAYCMRCGSRTRRAKRLVGVAIRVEAVFFLAVIALVAGFVWVYAAK